MCMFICIIFLSTSFLLSFELYVYTHNSRHSVGRRRNDGINERQACINIYVYICRACISGKQYPARY